MTPKQKSEELVKKMDVIHYMKLHGKNSNSKGLPISMYDDQIKQCALIAVDEILKGENNFIQTNEHYKYWYEVKQEINGI